VEIGGGGGKEQRERKERSVTTERTLTKKLTFSLSFSIFPKKNRNKLGATLANAGRAHEAAAAYRKALDAKPNYVRAWTNMG